MSQALIVSVRVTSNERQLLEDTASHTRTNLSDFIRRKALEAAEEELLDRRLITIPADKWEALEAWTQAPAKKYLLCANWLNQHRYGTNSAPKAA